MRDSMVFYRSFLDAVTELPPKDFKACVLAILRYGMDGEVPSGRGIEKTVFAMAKPQIDRNNQKYINGSKGGRPRNQTKTEQEPNENRTATDSEPKITEPKPTETKSEKSKPNVNVNDNVIINTHTPRVRAREDFVSTYSIQDDAAVLENVTWDFDALMQAYKASLKFLTVHPVARCTSWIAKHYTSIITGKYKDMDFAPQASGIAAPKGLSFEQYSDEQLNSMFTQITEDDE